MVLKSGTIIPFQYKNEKRLISIENPDGGPLSISDFKTAISSTFAIQTNYDFYNKKIMFHIPEDLLIPYLEQSNDLTNFVIEIICQKHVYEGKDKVSKAFIESKIQSKPSRELKRSLIEDSKDVPDVITKTPKIVISIKEESIDQELKTILSQTKGVDILSDYADYGYLTEENRCDLIKLIVNYEFEKIIVLNKPVAFDCQRYLHIAAGIARMFPGEDPNIYYHSEGKIGHLAEGKLFTEFIARKCKHLETVSINSSQETIDSYFPELVELLVKNSDWHSYFKAWRQTYELRMMYVRFIKDKMTYFDKFLGPSLKNILELVEYDFDRLHPEKMEKPLDNWNKISERIFTEALLSCRKDVPLILDLYGNMPQLSSFMMLSYLFQNHKSESKAFKRDDPRNLIVHMESMDDTPAETFREFCRKEKQFHPMVYASGKKADELKFYCVVGYHLFSMDSALNAVVFCFMCYQVLHLSYPEEKKQLWQVVQKAFYDIHTQNDDAELESILNIFNNL